MVAPTKEMVADEAPGADDVELILREIDSANRRMERWVERGESVVSLYRGEGDKVNEGSDQYNILWSISETQRPFLYSRTPKPIVKRRFLEPDEPARIAAELLERGLDYSMEVEGHEFTPAVRCAVDDFMLPGRGQVRVVYDAEFEEEVYGVDDDGETLTRDRKAYEYVCAKYVYWKDFVHSDGREWSDVWWVAFGSFLTKQDLREQFGEGIADDVPLVGDLIGDDDDPPSYRKGYDRRDCARVWEFWNKRTKKVYKVAEGYDEFLEKPLEDPYELEKFFPCPEPLDMIRTTGSLIPVPEYKMYESLAAEVNTLTARIMNLVRAMRAVGIYDSGMADIISRMVRGNENELIPIENYAQWAMSGGTKGAIEWFPIAQVAEVMVRLVEQRQLDLNSIYELTGVVDILRGVAVPRETKGAAEARASFASGRMGEKQRKVERFAQQTLALMAEVIAEHFDPETLFMITGAQITPQTQAGMQQAVQILRNDLVRGFKIEVETDSTIAPDAQREKEELVEFLGGISGFIQAATGGVQAGLMTPEIAKEIVLFAARRFRTGRQLEDVLSQLGAQPQGEQPPDPAVQAQQMKMQVETQKLELERTKIEGDQALEAQKLMLEAAKLAQTGQIEEKKIEQKHLEALINRDTARINAQGGNSRAN